MNTEGFNLRRLGAGAANAILGVVKDVFPQHVMERHPQSILYLCADGLRSCVVRSLTLVGWDSFNRASGDGVFPVDVDAIDSLSRNEIDDVVNEDPSFFLITADGRKVLRIFPSADGDHHMHSGRDDSSQLRKRLKFSPNLCLSAVIALQSHSVTGCLS